MTKSLRFFLLSFLSISFLCSCASHNKPQISFLEKRADYEDKERQKAQIKDLKASFISLKRTEPHLADIWIHPHELPSGDFFQGGWVKTLLSHSAWEVEGYQKNHSLIKK